MEIADEHVQLLVEGVPVVARLTSPEQAAQLAERRVAQFIVREASEGAITLQLAKTDSSDSKPAAPPGTSQLISGLLTKLGVRVDETTTTIALALINRGLPVTAGSLDALSRLLATLPHAGATEAEVAAALKAAGLPLAPEILQLVTTVSPQMGAALNELETQLHSLAHLPLPAQTTERIQHALHTLAALKLDWSAPPEKIAQQLQKLVTELARPLEQQLAHPDPPPNALMALAQLRAELATLTPVTPQLERALHGLDRFLDAARVNHLLNTAPTQPTLDGHWLTLNLPLGAEPPTDNVHLRVAYRSDEDTAIDAAHTRLVLQVDLEAGQALEVDLSVVERQIGAWVYPSDPALVARAEAELPALAEGLAHIGFALKTARVEAKDAPASPRSMRELNVEA
jgi:hypothetical protein